MRDRKKGVRRDLAGAALATCGTFQMISGLFKIYAMEFKVGAIGTRFFAADSLKVRRRDAATGQRIARSSLRNPSE